MPSAKRNQALPAVLALCAVLLAGGAMGCETTQEKAAEAQAQAQRVLDARAERQKERKKAKAKKAKHDKAKQTKGTTNE